MNKDLQMAKKIAEKIYELGGETYFVGGYVRDKLLNKPNKDIDIEIHNISPEQLYSVLDTFGDVQTQGASFGVYNIKGYDIDIAQPRMEHATGRGHKDFEVYVDPFIGTEAAAKRRDFTMNALMENVVTGEIIDCFGGIDDINKKVIRHVDNVTFMEDPLRVLRGAQFASRFGFTIADETKTVMQSMDLSVLSSERIYGEMRKALLKSNKPSVFFHELRSVNQLHEWFPEIEALIGCEQNKTHHPEGDVWNHTMKVMDCAAAHRKEAEYPEYFMMASLCHDLGKPVSVSVDDNGVIHNYGHEKAGIDVASAFLNRINNDKKLSKYVCNMIEKHMQPHNAYINHVKIKNTNKMFDDSISKKDLCLLADADTESKGDTHTLMYEHKFLQERLDIYNKMITLPEVQGSDLIQLGMTPGPEFSEILQNAHKQHLAGVAKDKVLQGIETIYKKKQHIASEKSENVNKNNGIIAVPPGKTIIELLEDRNIGKETFAAEMLMTKEQADAFLSGKTSLTTDVAEKLEKILKVPASFWIRLEEIYRKDREYSNEEQEEEEEEYEI